MSCWRRYGDSRQSARTRRSTCICTGCVGNWASPRRSRATCAPCGGSDSGWWRRTEAGAGLRQRRHVPPSSRSRSSSRSALGLRRPDAATRPSPTPSGAARWWPARSPSAPTRPACERAVAASGDDPATRPVVHGLGVDEPAARAAAASLDAAGRRAPLGGRRRRRRRGPAGAGRCSATGRPWSRSSSPTPTLTGGAGRDWWLLLGVAAGLVIASVIVVDRLAARRGRLGPQPGPARRWRSATATWAYGSSRAARASWPRPGTPSTGWPTGWSPPAPTSGNWSPTCRTGCVRR